MYPFKYNTYEPYSTYYAYTSTTTVPTYTLQHTLLSLADQQARIYAQRQALEAEEQRVRTYRQATLRRMRAQRLREAMEGSEIEDIVNQIVERDRLGSMDDRQIAEAVMYDPFTPPRFPRFWVRVAVLGPS
jgi:hypothetical protein